MFSKLKFPKRARAMFMVKDFGAQGELKVNHSQISYFDFPEIAMALSTKPGQVSVQEAIQRFNKKERFFYSFSFNKKERFFYSFSNMNGMYYPAIHELKVDGPSRDPDSWSMSGSSYMPN
jgi:hypothetical protein